jgi:hypothetical protein
MSTPTNGKIGVSDTILTANNRSIGEPVYSSASKNQPNTACGISRLPLSNPMFRTLSYKIGYLLSDNGVYKYTYRHERRHLRIRLTLK